MDGILNVYKERGFTSHDVVAKLRGILKMKKIGHTGTLDPDACGVLPVCLGQATKVCDLLTDKKKTYETVLLLGRVTDTQDVSGTTETEQPVTVSEEQVREVIASFQGDQIQVPPMYSARKVNGKKLYELAREGQVIEREARPVTFYEISILKMELPRVQLRVTCSKGTYIRTLCHDIGQKLGCGGCMEELLRTEVAPFQLADSLTLSQIEEIRDQGRLEEIICPVERLFAHLPAKKVKGEFSRYLYNGNPLREEWLEPYFEDTAPLSEQSNEETKELRIYTEKEQFFGIYIWKKEDACYRVKKIFYNNSEGQK